MQPRKLAVRKKILVIQLRQLGDILLTTPCLRALKEDALDKGEEAPEVVFLSHPMGRLVLRDNPYMDELVTYPPDGAWRAEWKLARQLRARRFDLVFDFMNNPRSAFYARMTGAPERLAFTSARRPAYTLTVPKPQDAGYIVREKFALLKAAGFLPQDERLVFTWTDDDAQVYRSFLAEMSEVAAAPLRVVLSATHRREVRRWPIASYAALADRLVRDWGAAVLWLHGPGEESLVDEAMALTKECTYKMPPTPFAVWRLSGLSAICSSGTPMGPSHVAVAVDVPSLQLHGHTRALSWCPNTERHRAVQSPEFGKVAMPSMEPISVDAVWDCLSGMLPVIQSQKLKRQSKS